MLVVIAPAGANKKRAMWLCRCDCGKEKDIRGHDLRRGYSRSCGCRQGKWLPTGEAAFRQIVRFYKKNAANHNRVFFLSDEQCHQLFKGDCFYCGEKPSNTKSNNRLINGEYVYNGIDRLDNKKGYVAGNVVSCCRKCNVAKAQMGCDEFIAWCSKIVARWNRL